MIGKSWQQRLEELLRSEQRHALYSTLARNGGMNFQGLRDMMTRPRLQPSSLSRGSQGSDSRLGARPATGPAAPSWDSTQSSREEPSRLPTGESDEPRRTAAAPVTVPASAPHAATNITESDPHVSLAVRWCRLSGLQDSAEWLQKHWPAAPEAAGQICHMHLLVVCLRLDPESTKSIVRDGSEFSSVQVMRMVHRASRLFYEFAYKAQDRAGLEEISGDIIYSEASRFLRWMQSELRSSPYSWLGERLHAEREGYFKSEVHDAQGDHQGQVKPLSFGVHAGPPDNQRLRPIVINAQRGRHGAR